MPDLQLIEHEHRRLFVVGIDDQAADQVVNLPGLDDWHEAVHLYNEVAKMYPHALVYLDQVDIHRVSARDAQEVIKGS